MVSVIIPCYNHGHYLPDALDSVLTQIYSDWEALIVDDGSTDDTAQVTQRYAVQDPRILYHYQVNAGLAAARNAGIDIAVGEFLAFLDADDAWDCEFLATCVAALREQPQVAAVYAGYVYMDEAGHPLPGSYGAALTPQATTQRLIRSGFFPPCSVLARTEAVRAAGCFDEELDGRGTEDWDLWLRLSGRGGMRGLPNRVVRYRVSPASMSTDLERMHRNRIAVLTKHLGPPDGAPETWPLDKREAYAWAFQAAAVQYISQRQPDEGWERLAHAAAIWPEILVQPETHYELACWDQPRGYRGQAEALDLERSAPLVLAGLEGLFAEGGDDLRRVRSGAYGQAYLASAMLADQAGRWGLARRYMLRALGTDPRLLRHLGMVRRLAKLMTDPRIVVWLRSLRARAIPS